MNLFYGLNVYFNLIFYLWLIIHSIYAWFQFAWLNGGACMHITIQYMHSFMRIFYFMFSVAALLFLFPNNIKKGAHVICFETLQEYF